MRYVVILILVLISSSAEARRKHLVQQAPLFTLDINPMFLAGSWAGPTAKNPSAKGRTRASNAQIVAHPAGCPRRAFCGCGASVRIFGRPIRSLYLARNWFKFPPAQASPGMVAVRRHHVFVILAVNGDGTVRAWDANSGRRLTRIHNRSLAGYSVRNPNA